MPAVLEQAARLVSDKIDNRARVTIGLVLCLLCTIYLSLVLIELISSI